MIQNLLPFATTFLFVFAIIYGLLTISGKFGKKVNILLALVFGLVSASHEPTVTFIQNILPLSTILLLVLFLVVFVKEVFSKGDEQSGGKDIPSITVLGIIVLVLGGTSGILKTYAPMSRSMYTNLLWLIGIIIVITMFYLAYTKGASKNE